MEMEVAIFEDCLNLIDAFVERGNGTFESFCKQWKNAKFQHIYAVQTTAIEVIQTTKTILHLAKRIACAKDELGKLGELNGTGTARRIGGIFLMYAIYFKQPTKQYVKILMSYETWNDFSTFVLTNVQSDMNEVRYMFWHLYKVDAFRFTALDYDVGLENFVDYDRLYDIHNGIKSDEVIKVKLNQKLRAVAETGKILPNLVVLEDEYNSKKKILTNSNKSAKALPPTKIFQDIQNAVKSIHNVLDANDINNSTSMKVSNCESKRKELKRKAAGNSEHTANDSEESGDDDTFQTENMNKHFGRPTVRKIMTQKLPDHITIDLKNSSSEDEDSTEVLDTF